MMNAHAHLLLSTTFSMIITFVLHCVLHQTRVDSSLVQQYIFDVMRDFMITVRCWFDGRNEFMICSRLLMNVSDWNLQVSTFCMFVIIPLLLLLYGIQILNRFRPVIQTVMIVWLLARFCEGKYSCYEVDVITIYFLIWQCAYVMCKWEDHDFSYPLLILQQGSFCTSAALLAFLMYDYEYRFLPIQLNFTLLWLWSLYDVVTCLHINGRLRMFLHASLEYSPPGLYYTYDFEDVQIDEIHFNDDSSNSIETYLDSDCLFLGIGDFIAFNLMTLLITDPMWPATTKLYVFIGCIFSIQIGHFIVGVVQSYWEEPGMPVLPFVVIPFSAYATFVYYIMYNTITEGATQSCM